MSAGARAPARPREAIAHAFLSEYDRLLAGALPGVYGAAGVEAGGQLVAAGPPIRLRAFAWRVTAARIPLVPADIWPTWLLEDLRAAGTTPVVGPEYRRQHALLVDLLADAAPGGDRRRDARRRTGGIVRPHAPLASDRASASIRHVPNARVPALGGPASNASPGAGTARRGAGVLRSAGGEVYVHDDHDRLWRVYHVRWDPARRRHRTADRSVADHLLFLRPDGTRRAAPIPIGGGHRLDDGAICEYLAAAQWLPTASPTTAPVAAARPEKATRAALNDPDWLGR